jgi:hypothetical protein
VLAGAGKFLIDRSNVCTFVIRSVQQRPTKSIWGMSDKWKDAKAKLGPEVSKED